MLRNESARLEKDLNETRWQACVASTLEDDLKQMHRLVSGHEVVGLVTHEKTSTEAAVAKVGAGHSSADHAAAGISFTYEFDEDAWRDSDTGVGPGLIPRSARRALGNLARFGGTRRERTRTRRNIVGARCLPSCHHSHRRRHHHYHHRQATVAMSALGALAEAQPRLTALMLFEFLELDHG